MQNQRYTIFRIREIFTDKNYYGYKTVPTSKLFSASATNNYLNSVSLVTIVLRWH